MSTVGRNTAIGELIVTTEGSLVVNSTGATHNSSNSFDRTGFDSCVLSLLTGAASGSPTTQLADAKLQESATGVGAWTDITGAAVTQIAADNGTEKVNVDLSGVKQYIRSEDVVAFTGGSSPAWPVCASITLGGARRIIATAN